MNIIDLLIKESESYLDVSEIGKSIQPDANAHSLPIQPLYLGLKQSSFEVAASYLPYLSKVQREAMLNIDLWIRDSLDLESFPFWIKAYAACGNGKIRTEFMLSNQFALFLKGKFHINTFDLEEPCYPEHDNYFLTEDNLLLFEFDPDNDGAYIDDVQELIKELYSEFGVENAYVYLFKIVADGFLDFQEGEFARKSVRMKELGFVSYMDALELDSPFPSVDVMVSRLKKSNQVTPVVTNEQAIQVVHAAVMSSYSEFNQTVMDELSKIDDPIRLSFLKYDFVRLLNAKIERDMALKAGTVALASAGKSVKWILELGLDFLKSEIIKNHEPVFFRYDFRDVYRAGNTLILLKQKELRVKLFNCGFSVIEKSPFLGQYLSTIIDDSFDSPIRIASEKLATKSKKVGTYNEFLEWSAVCSFVINILPFVQRFHTQFEQMEKGGLLLDSYYLNYTVDQIDFEAVLMSSFANHLLGNYQGEKGRVKKMGLTLAEFKKFATTIMDDKGEVSSLSSTGEMIDKFIADFGFSVIEGSWKYIFNILRRQMEGYDYANLPDLDFKHVGGPIILAS